MSSTTDELFLLHLAQHLASEPEAPDLEKHSGSHLECVARIWNEWDATRSAIYLLLGSRLVNARLRAMGVDV